MTPHNQSIISAVLSDIFTWTHFFIRNDSAKGPLTPPYTEYFHTHGNTSQFLLIIEKTISIDRVKKAFSESLILIPDTPNNSLPHHIPFNLMS